MSFYSFFRLEYVQDMMCVLSVIRKVRLAGSARDPAAGGSVFLVWPGLIGIEVSDFRPQVAFLSLNRH